MVGTFDAEVALAFLTQRFPCLDRGERIEIRALDHHKGGTVVAREWFPTPAAAVEWVKTLNMGWEIYYGVNPRLGRGGSKVDVGRVLVGHADLDWAKQGEEEARAALDAYEYAPTWVVHSGNGLHVYWAIEPLDGQAEGGKVEAFLRALYARLGNPDRVQDISRILRLPGTFNNKYGEPRPVRVVEHTPTNRYTLAQLQTSVPALPPAEKVGGSLGGGITQPGDLDEEEVRNLLAYISPTLPYPEYLAVWMAVHALYPDERGLRLVDDWSSEARAAAGQFSSPRTQPNKHHDFRRSGASGAIGAGTLYHYAALGGWTPPPRPVPLIKRKQREAEWRNALNDLGELDPRQFPYHLGKQIEHLGETTRPLPLDWSVQAALTYSSIALAGIRFENLGLNRWFLGVARSNSGKNIITDALYDVWKQVTLRGTNKVLTSGSPEGMWRELDGVGERLLAYHDEFEAYLRSFQRDYMSTARGALCSLYDGRDVHHVLAKRTVHAIEPYLVVVATTTPKGIADYMSLGDLQSGYANRFGVVFADHTDLDIEQRPSRQAAAALAADLTRHYGGMMKVTQARWDTPRGETPAVWRDLCASLGVGSGRVYRVEDSVDDLQPAYGRLLARIKKDSGNLEALEANPQIRGDTLVVCEKNLRLAIQIVMRGAAFARGMESIVNVSADQRLMDKIARAIRENPDLSKSQIRNLVHADIKPFGLALDTMVEEGRIQELPLDPGQRVRRYRAIG